MDIYIYKQRHVSNECQCQCDPGCCSQTCSYSPAADGRTRRGDLEVASCSGTDILSGRKECSNISGKTGGIQIRQSLQRRKEGRKVLTEPGIPLSTSQGRSSEDRAKKITLNKSPKTSSSILLDVHGQLPSLEEAKHLVSSSPPAAASAMG